MSVALTQPMTLDAFLAWEERQELPWEFDGFAPVAMTGGSAAHAAIERNLIIALGNRLRGRPCQVFTSNLKVFAAGSIRYPDAFVICRPFGRQERVIEDPVVVFEILSHSTALTDRFIKAREYLNTPSIRRYVILEQDFIGATVLERASDQWISHAATDGDHLVMPEIDVTLPLSDLYEGLVFDAEAPEQA